LSVSHVVKQPPCWTQKILGTSAFQVLSDNHRASTQSFDLCSAKLVVFWDIDLSFGKLIFVMGN